MIETRKVELPLEKEKALRAWLNKPEIETLKRIVGSKVADYQVKAANASINAVDIPQSSEQDEPAVIRLEKGAVLSARRYQHFLDVLQEIEKHDDPFTLSQVSC